MDNVGCYGTEEKLIDCSYHTDTSGDRHSGDVWIDCGSADGCDNANNVETCDQMAASSDTAIIMALVSLAGLILLVVALVGYILYSRKSKLQQRMRCVTHNIQL